MQINKRVLYVAEAACVLCCSTYQIYNLIHKNELNYDEDKILEKMLHVLKEKEIIENGFIDKDDFTL